MELTRRFGDFTAVDAISFEVPRAEIFGFLGPNGAGKTTTISMLCTLLRPTAGRATVGGHDVLRESAAVRRQIGIVFQDTTLDDRLTAAENLRFHAEVYGMDRRIIGTRTREMLERVGLADRANDIVINYPGGMKRRLEIARGLMHWPTALFLDEPTIGLDPQTRRSLWEYAQSLREEEGVTIFMTTHYMDEAEACDRIAIIDHGRIVALDTPSGPGQRRRGGGGRGALRGGAAARERPRRVPRRPRRRVPADAVHPLDDADRNRVGAAGGRRRRLPRPHPPPHSRTRGR